MGKIKEAIEKYEIEEIRYDFSDRPFFPKGDNLFDDVNDQDTAEFILKKLKVQWKERVVTSRGKEVYLVYGRIDDIMSADFEQGEDPEELEFRVRGRAIANWDIDRKQLWVGKRR